MESKFLALIEEIDECRQSGFVRMALHAALSLPDICSTAETGEKKLDQDSDCSASSGKQGSRYKEWWNRRSERFLHRAPLLDGKQLYQLRNNFSMAPICMFRGKQHSYHDRYLLCCNLQISAQHQILHPPAQPYQCRGSHHRDPQCCSPVLFRKRRLHQGIFGRLREICCRIA